MILRAPGSTQYGVPGGSYRLLAHSLALTVAALGYALSVMRAGHGYGELIPQRQRGHIATLQILADLAIDVEIRLIFRVEMLNKCGAGIYDPLG